MSVLAAALAWAEMGVRVHPVGADKSPRVLGEGWDDQSTTDPTQIRRWFEGRYKDNGLGVQCGPSSRLIVLDLDIKASDGVKSWADIVDGHGKVDTYVEKTPSGGVHVFYSYDTGEELGNGENRLGPGVDVRAGSGGNIVVAPTVGYSVYRDVPLAPAPDWLLALLKGAKVKPKLRVVKAGDSTGLTWLLENPPVEGERYGWWSEFWGHIIKMCWPYKDRARALCEVVNQTHPAPIDDIDENLDRLWDIEADKKQASQDQDASTGYLLGAGGWLMTLVVPAKGQTPVPGEIGNFDLRATHLATDVDERVYVGKLLRARDNSEHEFVVSSKTLVNVEKTNAWLGSYGVGIMRPLREEPQARSSASMGSRLSQYMESQQPAQCHLAHHLGEQDTGGWLHHDGLIGAGEPVVPHPKLREWAPFKYGFGDAGEAIAVLKEVLTFQDDVTCAVFGSWWAMTPFKGRLLREHASMFPFMAIESASESGKTSGFFGLMMQLNGSLLGPGGYTRASFRDYVSGHRNGIVWLDDLTETADLELILRLATGEERMAKKGQNNFSQETVRLVAPIVISGEGMESLFTEQAMADRSVTIDPPNPKRRKSLHNPDQLQYEDVLGLQRRYNHDLTPLAGSLLLEILKRDELLLDLRGLKTQPGRAGEKAGILRVGARILSDLTGDEHWTTLVDHWCTEQPERSAHFLLTKMWPRLWRDAVFPTSPKHMPPVYRDRDGHFWVSDAQCADRWERIARNVRDRQMGGLHAIAKSRKALGIDGKGTRKYGQDIDTGDRGQVRYHRLDLALSEVVLAASDYVPVARSEGQQEMS